MNKIQYQNKQRPKSALIYLLAILSIAAYLASVQSQVEFEKSLDSRKVLFSNRK